MKFLIFITYLLVASSHAHALNVDGVRPSDNVDDKRDETLYPEEAVKLLSRYGKVAEAGAMPFICPGLKQARALAADLGSRLSAAKTPYAMKQDFDKDFENSDLFEGKLNKDNSDACEGSKSAATSLIQNNVMRLQRHLDLAKQALQQSNQRAGQTLELIHDTNHSPSIGDRVNNLISQCPKANEDYQTALVAYINQVSTLYAYYNDFVTLLQKQSTKISSFNCSSISTASTISGSSAPIPLPPKRPKDLGK